MGAAAAVADDRIVGSCATHVVPGPTGSPVPVPALPFSAPLATGLATTVTIGGRKAAVEGSEGVSSPPHQGLHPTDPYALPTAQRGRVATGSSTVRFDGRPAAYTGCRVEICAAAPGQLTGTAATVFVGP